MKIDQDEAPGQETNYTHAGLIVVSLWELVIIHTFF